MNQRTGGISFQIAAIIGMAAVWASFFNQLLYPVSLTFNRTHDENVFAFHILYSALIVAVTVAFALLRKHIDRSLLANERIVALFGILGSAGIFLVGQLDFANAASVVGLGVGVGFVAVYAPAHFLFWCMRFAENRSGRANAAMSSSIALFALFSGARLMLGIHSFGATLACPLISSAAMLFVAHDDKPHAECLGEMDLRTLPYAFILPCFIFVVLCNVGILLFNSSAVLQQDPPFRPHMYFVATTFFLVATAFFVQRKIRQRRVCVILFSIASLLFIASTILATTLGFEQLNGGSVAFIAADICLSGFMWICIVSAASKTHASPTLACALFLIVAVTTPRFVRAAFMYHGNLLPAVENSLQLFLTTTFAALLSVTVFVVAIMLFFWRKESAQMREADDAAKQQAAEEEAFEELKSSFGLSDREIEITRLVCQNLNAKEMSKQLFIAESTIYTHLKRIYRKTGVHSKQELIRLAVQIKRKHGLS